MPVLERNQLEQETKILFTRLRDLPPRQADRKRIRARIIELYLPLARKLARRFNHRGESLDDLVQVASLGLVKAVDRYDLATNNHFLTYAIPTIVGELKRHFRDKGWSLRVPRRLQELRLAINAVISDLSQRMGGSPRVDDLAAELNRSPEEILEALESGNAYSAVSWHTPMGDAADNGEIGDLLGAIDAHLGQVENRQTIRAALMRLPQREQHIVYLRFFRDLTQTEIGKQVGLSQMQVSRVLSRSLEAMRGQLTKPVSGGGPGRAGVGRRSSPGANTRRMESGQPGYVRHSRLHVLQEKTMNQNIGSVMTKNPVTASQDTPMRRIAEKMSQHQIGDVLLVDTDKQLCGVVTDRDIVVRGVAAARDVFTTPARDIASPTPVSVTPADPIDQAVSLMREYGVRRLPVCENGQPVGVVSLGDLAIDRDPHSALADISRQPASR